MKENFDTRMISILEENAGARLLLHACCAPCSSYCLMQVSAMDTTVFFYNPNIDCREEYEKRKGELVRFLRETGQAEFLECGYAPEEFLRAAKGLEREKEGGARCTECFKLRLRRTAEEAKERGFDYFGTTLTVSPHKDAERINRIGFALGEELGVKYLPSDFKKRDGYLQSVRLSERYSLYRQNYCGCAFSKEG